MLYTWCQFLAIKCVGVGNPLVYTNVHSYTQLCLMELVTEFNVLFGCFPSYLHFYLIFIVIDEILVTVITISVCFIVPV